MWHFLDGHRLKDDPFVLLTVLAAAAVLAFLLLIVLTVRQGTHRARDERLRADQARAAESELAELKGRLAQMTEITSLRQEELTRTLNDRLDRVGQAVGTSVAQITETAAQRQEELARGLNDRLDRATQHFGASAAQIAEITALRQEELARSLNERLDRATQHLGTSMEETGRRTADNLGKLYERLAVIDTAQRTITELSGQVVSLQDVLSNKQARGAFGQIRMEAIVEDGLPKGAYSFQATLSNGRRPDCLVHLPYAPAGIVIDAKFPLEAFEALRQAQGEAAQREAQGRVRRDVSRHIEDIAAKYFIPGETQDTAMMFVPSEFVYAELHEGFPDLIQKGHRARIVIVSPNMLMLAVQTMMAILKDVRMREQADVIQREVGHMLKDVAQLKERVQGLQRHFAQLGPDVEKILASTDKIASRAARIDGLEVEDRKEPPEALSSAAE